MDEDQLLEEGWVKVIHAFECISVDEDDEVLFCPKCIMNYSDCPCPGPHMDEEYEYKEVDGILYAKKL